MILAGISNLATTLETQVALRRSRMSLEQAQTELSSGRHADVNLTLGSNVTRNLNWRLALSQTTKLIDTNTQANEKATTTQTVLDSIKNSANTFLSTLIGAATANNGQALIQSNAAMQIQAFQQALNTSYAGQYLFGGQNSSTPPLNTYLGGPAQSAFDTAFQSFFGFAKTDTQAANITPAQMTNFLQTSYEALFQAPNWNANLSNATSQNVKIRIDATQMVDVSANANEAPFKDIMKAMVASMDAGTGHLNQSTFHTVVDYAITKIANSTQGIAEIGARIGSAQQATTAVGDKHQSVKSILEKQIRATEGVDPSEAAVRVNDLITQLDANYAVTGKISKLSLLTYI